MTVIIVVGTAFLHLWGWIPDILIAALIMTVAVMALLLRWARFIAVIMIVDLDANNGEGLVTINRLIPAPNLPESVQLPLQDAAEGSSEINTIGIINTLITLFKPLRFLRALSVGDLTFRAKGSDFTMTMYNLQDPEGVRKQIQSYWKAIAKVINDEKKKKERAEQIEQMTLAVAAGVKQALTELNSPPTITPLPAAAPSATGDVASPPRNDASDDGGADSPLNGRHGGTAPR
ncbi:MAG: hypothetical protein RMK99_01335 [Anaerolineales bacterium]|nr:hypothetical protein [Anaerolineales bacterium]